jgi:hypothetical protein
MAAINEPGPFNLSARCIEPPDWARPPEARAKASASGMTRGERIAEIARELNRER